MKIRCEVCKKKIATWHYVPDDDYTIIRYFCDDCIERGCSCNIINQETGEEYRDEQNRLFPCCEYDENMYGFDEWADDFYYKLLEDFPDE